MKIISSALLFFLFTAVLAANTSSTDSSSTQTTETSPSDTSPTTTLETTTLQSTTTTDVVSTTISTTSTTISSTSSSSEAPSTTSSPSPSPVTPTGSPEDKVCKFNVTEDDKTCIKVELQADFIIYFEGKKYPLVLGCNASYAGSTCSSNETQTLVLSESTNYTLTMVFEKHSGKVLVKNVTFSYNLPQGPMGTVSNYSEDLFQAKAGNSYLCKSKFDIHLENVTMEIHEVHIQAFLEEGKTFGAAEECEADEKVGDIVPIAVGIALASLIIIVLIAYLVGRRRSRQKGYQSV